MVVVWCGGFNSDNNTTLGLCWVALGCGNNLQSTTFNTNNVQEDKKFDLLSDKKLAQAALRAPPKVAL